MSSHYLSRSVSMGREAASPLFHLNPPFLQQATATGPGAEPRPAQGFAELCLSHQIMVPFEWFGTRGIIEQAPSAVNNSCFCVWILEERFDFLSIAAI